MRFTAPPGQPATEALLTFKGPAEKEGLRVREAFDLKMVPHEQVVPLLLALGFLRQFSFEKDRETWAFRGCLVELDTLPHFGRFVEIEGPSEETVRDVQSELGLGGMAPYQKSYSHIVTEYLDGLKSGSRDLTF